MKYRLFISDFDGTLVRDDGTVSERNKSAIARYTAAGGIFAVCTGRMLSSILPRVRELGFTEGIVAAFQGATIADIATGELLKNDCFLQQDALKAVRLLESKKLHIHVYTVDEMFVNVRDEGLEAYERICRVKGTLVNEPLSRKIERENTRVVKMLAMVMPQERYALKEALQKELGEAFYVTVSAEYLVEVMPKGQNKGLAVDFLSRKYRILREEIAAMGDQLNDIPMLERAGGKFTPRNGEEELKKIAVTVASNEEDGVAEAILKYALGESDER